LYHSAKTLKEISDELKIVQIRYKGKWPVEDRDFVMLVNKF